MSQSLSEATILVPIDASDPGDPSADLVELLSPHSLVVLGYYPVPDQSSAEQLRSQFGEEATAAIDEITDRFTQAGADAESLLVFTRDRSKTIDRVAAEHEANAILTTGAVGESLDQILVPMRGDENLDQIIDFVGVILQGSEASVTVFNVASSDKDASRGELIVRGACDRLQEQGIDPDRVNWRQEENGAVSDAIVGTAAEYDLLVVGESKPSLRERILGEVTNRVIDKSPAPVLVVRKM